MWALLLASVAAQYDCGLCVTSPAATCCTCCVAGVLQPALCNDAAFSGCLAPPTPSVTPVPSTTATATLTPSGTSILTPVTGGAASGNSIAYSTQTSPCAHSYWQVPTGVRNVSVLLWGAGARGSYGGGNGGAGAFVEGLAYVTPGETLRITVGSNAGDGSEACGYGGGSCGWCSPGGGATFIARLNVVTSAWVVMAIAAGGGGAVRPGWGGPGSPGRGIPASGDCGLFNPAGSPCVDNNVQGGQPGGGGGWVGGSRGQGGISCAPGLYVSMSASGVEYDTANSASPYWQPCLGCGSWTWGSGGREAGPNGLAVINWNGINPSPSNSAASTRLPTVTASSSATNSRTASVSVRASSSRTATATKTPFCGPAAWQLFPYRDLDGTRMSALRVASETQCQSVCCDTAGCAGYAMDANALSFSSQTVCVLMANVTQLIPNNFASSGVRTGTS